MKILQVNKRTKTRKLKFDPSPSNSTHTDKFRHCWVTCKASFSGLAFGPALLIGVLYEACGQFQRYSQWPELKNVCTAFGDFKDSLMDVVANGIGASCAIAPLIPCDTCCGCYYSK